MADQTGSGPRGGRGRRQFLALLGAAGASALAGCGSDSGSGDGGSTTPPEAASDSPSPTATPRPTATAGPTATAEPTETPTAEPTKTPTATQSGTPRPGSDDPVGSLPEPPTEAQSRPSGEPGNLRVLDWAGFSGAVSFTFDDGQPSHATHYDELTATGANLTFYVTENVDFAGADDAWRQAAADGHEIGNHTVSHPRADLSNPGFGEPLDSAAAEIEQCSQYITETTGQRDVWTVAAPYADTGWTGPAREADLFLNRGVGGGRVAPGDGTDPYNLPSYMAREGDTADRFDAEVDAARSNGEWSILTFHSVTPTDQQWYAPVDVDEITASIDRAMGFEDVWVDTVAGIGAYWRGQQLLAGAEPTETDQGLVWEWSLPEGFPAGQPVRVTVDGGTLRQGGEDLSWNPRGYYEVSLDAESLTLVV